MDILSSYKKMKKIKAVGLVIRPNSQNLKKYYLQIKKKLEKQKIKLYVSQYSSSLLGCEGMEFEKMCLKSDFLIAIGGDGTLISLCRRSYKFKKPILGIYAGNLGFLTDIKCDEIESFLDKIIKGKYRIDNRMVLGVKFNYKDGKSRKVIAFNDTVFLRHSVDGMCHIKALVNNKIINNYHGDGLIVSTPTGSTAYNLSVGGPVVYPLTEALILTPISPHSLTQRPLIMPVNFSIKFQSDNNLSIIIDGQETYRMRDVESIDIKIAKRGVKLIHRMEKNYFQTIKEKLNWGEL